MAELTHAQFEQAEARGVERLRGPRAISARYDSGRNRIVIRMAQGYELGLAPADVEGLHNAPVAALREVEIDMLGLAIRFPQLDVDLYVPALIEGVLGSPAWMNGEKMRRSRKQPSHSRRSARAAE